MQDKQSEKSSLLHKILQNNLLIMGFFVVLIWIYATTAICLGIYHSGIEEKQSLLVQYTTQAKEIINHATIHSEQIAKSSYLINQLKKEEADVDEIMIFFDYVNELMSSSAPNIHGEIKIYHNNPAIFESRSFSHTEKLPAYHSILAQLRKNLTIFDPSLTETTAGYRITMYRLLPWNAGCIMEYPILLNLENNLTYPMRIVPGNNPLARDSSYFREPVNSAFCAVMKIPQGELWMSVLSAFFICLLVLLLFALLLTQISKRTAKKTMREINDFIESITGETLLSDNKFFHTTYDLYELNIIKKTLQKLALEIQTYAEAVKNAELDNKELEMELLSMQLDPHMLYNSLAAIRLDAYHAKHQKIMDLIDNMVLYYRNILKKDRKFISVEQEIESIRKYLYINELSHEKKYPLETQIDENLKALQIPPQILHTFVENCIVHGLSGNQKDCLIRIKMRESQGAVITEIYDNGYGIPTEMLDRLNSGTLDSRHVGISNALKRLKLVYGEESSIRFDSEKNTYTKVSIRFPYSPEKKQSFETISE